MGTYDNDTEDQYMYNIVTLSQRFTVSKKLQQIPIKPPQVMIELRYATQLTYDRIQGNLNTNVDADKIVARLYISYCHL